MPMKVSSLFIEGAFIGYRRYLHEPSKVSSSAIEGIFMKTAGFLLFFFLISLNTFFLKKPTAQSRIL